MRTVNLTFLSHTVASETHATRDPHDMYCANVSPLIKLLPDELAVRFLRSDSVILIVNGKRELSLSKVGRGHMENSANGNVKKTADGAVLKTIFLSEFFLQLGRNIFERMKIAG